MDLSSYYLFSDIDGTLGTTCDGIPQKNVDAITHFVNNGGNFALCTGRWATDIKHFTVGLPVNEICIVNNGGAFYDYAAGKYFGVRALPDQAVEYLQHMLSEEDALEAVTVIESGYFRIVNPKSLSTLLTNDFDCRLMKIGDIHAPHLKFVFNVPDSATAKEKISRWNSWNFPGVSFVQSSDTCVEMLPSGVNKGAAITQLCAMRGIPIEHTYFIGDCYNDREAFQTVGYSACVAEAPAELQRLCDCVLGPCMNGALADFIYMMMGESLRSA